MSRIMSILSTNEIRKFESPPIFNSQDRKKYFHYYDWIKEAFKLIRTNESKVGFILQHGYFKATKKFYIPRKYSEADIKYVITLLEIIVPINLFAYNRRSIAQHQTIILNEYGFKRFNKSVHRQAFIESKVLSNKFSNPVKIFNWLKYHLVSNKIELPSYMTMAEIISTSLRNKETELLEIIESELSSELKEKIKNTLLKNDESIFKYARFKKISQSTRPGKISEHVTHYKNLEILYKKVQPVIEKLSMSFESINYLAIYTTKARIEQLLQIKNENKLILYLIAFIAYEYYKNSDFLVDKIISSFSRSQNKLNTKHVEIILSNKMAKEEAASLLLNKLESEIYKEEETLIDIINDERLSDTEKIKAFHEEHVKYKIKKLSLTKMLKENLSVRTQSSSSSKSKEYYDAMESISTSCQRSLSPILKVLNFDEITSNKKILAALKHFQTGSNINNAPISFISDEEQKIIADEKNNTKPGIYKYLLFEKVVDGIKAGTLNLKNSYRYKPVDSYLLLKDTWEKDKETLLEDVKLVQWKNFNKIRNSLETMLDKQYKETNENIISGKNKHIKFKKDELVLNTPAVKDHDLERSNLANYLPKEYISLLDILIVVNKCTGFIDEFKHHSTKHKKDRPDDKVFLAAIQAIGCNIGIDKMKKISKQINPNTFENTINWFFSLQNLNQANDKILDLIGKFTISDLFKSNKEKTHTSSDGQKYSVGVDTLNSNESYKYFGKGRGSTVYGFIDDSVRLFYSTIISASEREAAYVIDGLLYNNVVKSDIHSTDTHGYSEIIFAITHLLEISFAPRIKNIKRQTLYSHRTIKEYAVLNYKILPKHYIKWELIEKEWDNILRLITTISLKETTASQILKRLSSYSKQHALYKALKEFGKCIKTIFILRYLDDLDLRQSIEKQLNKMELANNLSSVVFFGQNQEFNYSIKDEQEVAVACKRLIENSIICFNYLYFSQKVLDLENNKEEQLALIKQIQNGSMIMWQYVNLLGSFDFSEKKENKIFKFDLTKIFGMRI